MCMGQFSVIDPRCGNYTLALEGKNCYWCNTSLGKDWYNYIEMLKHPIDCFMWKWANEAVESLKKGD